MSELGGRPEREAIFVWVANRNRATALDGMRAAAMLLEMDAGAAGCPRECFFHVTVGLLELDQKIALVRAVDEGRARRERGAAIGDCGQRLVVDMNEGSHILCDVAVARDHHCHRLASKRNFIAG